MGWLSEDLKHEGYVTVELADGARASASTAAGPIVSLSDGSEQQRSDDEVVAWQLACDCSIPSERDGGRSTWLGERWERVATQLVEDVDHGKLYAPTGWAVDLFEERAELAEIARSMWRTHLAKGEALQDVRSGTLAVAEAELHLTESVARARAADQSWEEIGRAAGISKQAAHARWANASRSA